MLVLVVFESAQAMGLHKIMYFSKLLCLHCLEL